MVSARPQVVEYYGLIAPRFSDAALVGMVQDWVAPLAGFAGDGFGEELWISATPVTSLAVCTSGCAVTSEMGRRRISGPGRSIALMPEGLPNHYRCTGPLTFAHIYLSDDLLDRAAEAAGVPRLSGRLRDDLVFASDAILEQRTRDCLRSGLARSGASPLEMEARTLLLLDRLIDLHGQARLPQASGGLAPSQVRQVCDYLQSHLSDDVRLKQLAALVQLSPEHFCRAFKESTGLPPHAWLVRRRVERARELIGSSRLTIQEISSQVGYVEPSHLARIFRRAYGLSPMEYRRSMTGDDSRS